MRPASVNLYCQHVSRTGMPCNRTTTLPIEPDQTLREVIDESDWAIVDGELRCPIDNPNSDVEQ